MSTEKPSVIRVNTRPMTEDDLDAADRVVRVAFGTFVGAPDPATFFGDADYVRQRWNADPSAAYVAELDGEIVGSNFAARWGSFGFFGPLSIRPDLWNRGIAQQLLDPIVGLFDEWDVRLSGLFTFPHSTKHVGLYQKYGFRPRALTAVMAKPVDPSKALGEGSRFSALSDSEKETCLREAASLTDAIYPGLDVSLEVQSIDTQKLGDTILVWDDAGLAALAACHVGPNTEAGSGVGYIKFAGVRPGPDAARHFDTLLDACEAYAAEAGAAHLTAGVNTARTEAYEHLLAKGFRAQFLGIAMLNPNDAGFNRPGVFVLDDWR